MNAATSSAIDRRLVALLAAIFIGAVGLYWNGIGPGDAERYLRAALRWQEGAWLGDTHWALRHLFVLPMAASFAVFGASETAALLPNLLYLALTIGVTFRFGLRLLGARDSFIAAALIATSAFFAARPLELDVYGAETFFAALAMWLFIAAGDSGARARMIFAAGAAAGLASTIREQSAYLLAVFALLIALERRDAARSLALVCAGFGAVIAIELAIYAYAAGDPLYRYRIDLGHRSLGVNEVLTAQDASLAGRASRAATALVTTPATTPILFLAALSALYLRLTRVSLSEKARRAVIGFLAAAMLSAIVTPLVFNITSTRYYPLLTYAAFLVIAMAIGAAWSRRKGFAVAGAALVVIVNAAAADFVRDNRYAEARFVAALAIASTEPVYADSLTVNRARYQLMLKGWPPAKAAGAVLNKRSLQAGGLLFAPDAAPAAGEFWCVLERRQLRRNGWTHWLLRETGIARIFGDDLEARVARPGPSVLVRVLNASADAKPPAGDVCLPPAA